MTRFELPARPADFAQLLEDHHLVVLTDEAREQDVFAREMQEYFSQQRDVHLVRVDGRFAETIDDICRHVTAGGREIRGGHALSDLIDALRRPAPAAKYQYVLWEHADVMLDADVAQFSRIVNALCAVAAEHEHITDRSLVLQRAIFIGGAKLGAYAEDPAGQFCAWLSDDDDSSFWEVQSVLHSPPVLIYRLEG